MIKTVVAEFKWSPEIIGDLFFDDEDYLGLKYWYNAAIQNIKAKTPTKQ